MSSMALVVLDALCFTHCSAIDILQHNVSPLRRQKLRYFPIVQGWSWGKLQADTIAFYECVLQQHTDVDTCRRMGSDLHTALHPPEGDKHKNHKRKEL
jgi:hypothetical protein